MIKGQITLELHEIDFEVHMDPEFKIPDFVRYTVKTDLGNGCHDIEAAECDANTFMQALGSALQYDPDKFPAWDAINTVVALTKRRWLP